VGDPVIIITRVMMTFAVFPAHSGIWESLL